MKIQHKYIRNRHFRIKHWKRIRALEHPYETYMPYWYGTFIPRWTYEEQVNSNFESIAKRARAIESGKTAYCWESCPSSFRRNLNKENKAAVRHAMARINMGDYDYEVPLFKKDAAWLYW